MCCRTVSVINLHGFPVVLCSNLFIYLSDAGFKMLVTGAVVPPESKLVLPVFLRLCANNF